MRGKKDFDADVIVETHEFAEDVIEHFPVPKGKKAGDVLKQECPGLELFEKPHVILEQLIAGIFKEAVVPGFK